jgi:putative pyruvate formate lyase activating enzyme
VNRLGSRQEFIPAYRQLLKNGELEERAAQAYAHLEECDLCGWSCGVNRRAGHRGVCRTGERAKVSSYGPHLGEEAPLRGWRGSGTIFFTRCNLRCQFCQNHDISQTDYGTEVDAEHLAAIMLELQESGCHNINLVSPSHVVAPILAAVLVAARAGLCIPLVYNTGGYDSLTALYLLDGVIDIYMPDMKFTNANVGLHYSKIREYPKVNRAAVKEMHRQVGDLELDDRGIATRGLLVRHLVLPHGIAGTREIVQYLADEISPQTYLNLMDQYHPEFKARQYPQLSRRITPLEYEMAVRLALEAGLHRLDGR